MKLEKINYGKEKVHKIFLYGLISVVVLLLAVTFLSSKANYKISSSVQLAKGKINYKAPDLNIIAMYQENASGKFTGEDGKKYDLLDSDVLMPSAYEYEINEQNSYCFKTTESEHDDNVVLKTSIYDEHVIEGLSTNDKCRLFFDKIKASTEARTMEQLIANYYVHKKIRLSGTFNQSISETTRKTVYVASDDDGATYYFVGNPVDNWVKFGGYYWRMIRINGNGSIRMIYQGTDASATGEGTQIGTSKFNTVYNKAEHVGYWYSDNVPHGLDKPSIIYTALNDWFKASNIKEGTSFFNKIDSNAGFCNDRISYLDNSGVTQGGGFGSTITYYAAYVRLRNLSAVAPMFKCTNKDNDLFTYSKANQGNKKLENPVGLITADEVSYAGVVYEVANDSNYLATGSTYYTMSPGTFDGWGRTFRVRGNRLESASWADVSSSFGVRPVINLRSDVKLTGNGTSSNPYEVVNF